MRTIFKRNIAVIGLGTVLLWTTGSLARPPMGRLPVIQQHTPRGSTQRTVAPADQPAGPNTRPLPQHARPHGIKATSSASQPARTRIVTATQTTTVTNSPSRIAIGPMTLQQTNSNSFVIQGTNTMVPPGSVFIQTAGNNFLFFPGMTPFSFTGPGSNFGLFPVTGFNRFQFGLGNLFPTGNLLPAGLGPNSLLPPGLNLVPSLTSVLPPGIFTPLVAPAIDALLLSRMALRNPFQFSSLPAQNAFLFSTGFSPFLLPGTGLGGLPLLGSGVPNGGFFALSGEVESGDQQNNDNIIQLAEDETIGNATPEAERDRRERNILTKTQIGAFATTIWSASDLNILLDDLIKLQTRGVRGRDVPLNEGVLQHINVAPKRSPGSAGLLKESARLSWPDLLRDPAFEKEREKIESLVPKVVEQGKGGQVESADLVRLTDAVKSLREGLASEIQAVPAPKYIRAKRFVDDMQSGVKALNRPNAEEYFNHRDVVRTKNVRELVKYMVDNDLRFTPAVAGDEGAYLALYQALAGYDVAAHNKAKGNDNLAMRTR